MPFTFVPLLDFANHGDQSPDLLRRQAVNTRYHYDPETKTCSLIAGASESVEATREQGLLAGESVRVSYGRERDTSSFISLYGMMGNYDNIYDDVRLTLFNTTEGKAMIFQSLKDNDPEKEKEKEKKFREALIRVMEVEMQIERDSEIQIYEKVKNLVATQISFASGSIAVSAPVVPLALREESVVRERQELSVILLCYTLKVAHLFEKNETKMFDDFLNDERNVKEIAQREKEDWQVVRESLDSLIQSVYLSPEKMKGFSFPDSQAALSFPLIYRAKVFVDHLSLFAARIKPKDEENYFGLSQTKPLCALTYWKCCCAMILERELK
jgi:hypothetical protein